MPNRSHKNRSRNQHKHIQAEPIWVYGVHAVTACMQQQAENIVEVLCSKPQDTCQELLADIQTLGLSVHYVTHDDIVEHIGQSVIHQGIAIRIKASKSYSQKDILPIIEHKRAAHGKVLLLILDGVTDPRNLGACLRSANGAGVDLVIVPKDNAASITSVTRKTASGAAETTPFVQVSNLARVLRELQEAGVWVVGTDDTAEQSLYQVDLQQDLALVLGSEDTGIRALTAKTCDQLLSIPMLGTVNSLNVSVASAVCLYEAVRQRQ